MSDKEYSALTAFAAELYERAEVLERKATCDKERVAATAMEQLAIKLKVIDKRMDEDDE